LDPELEQLTERFPQRITYSDTAITQIAALSEEQQIVLADGLVRAYSKILTLLVEIKFSTYVPHNSFSAMQLLSTPETTVLDLDGFTVRVDICHKSFNWCVASIGLPGSLKHHTIKTKI
jgi:hypothetical protein